MGKSQKKRAMRRHNPMRVPDSHLPKGLAAASSTSSKTNDVPIIIQKMESADSSERKWACVAVSNLIHNDPSTRRLLQGKNVVRGLITRLTDSEQEVVVEAMGALRNLCIDGGYDICAEMYNKNILTSLKAFILQISGLLSQNLNSSATAPERARNMVYEFADNVITTLWCLSETSNKALAAINQMNLVPFLMSFLTSHKTLSLTPVLAAAQCLYVLTDDNQPIVDEVKTDAGYLSSLLIIVRPADSRVNGMDEEIVDERIMKLRVLVAGILRNLLPIPPPSAASFIDIDNDILLPLLQSVISSISLNEASTAVQQLVAQQASEPRIEKLSFKNTPKSDHKSQTERELERIEERLRTVQLALEIMTSVCAALPDPQDGLDIPDDTNNEDSLEDDDILSDSADDGMVVDNVASADKPRTPSLCSLVPLLLTLIHPVALSFPPLASPSPHPPTTSVLSCIHICALECLNNIFLSLSTGGAQACTRDQIAGQRTWQDVWSALGVVGLEFGLGQEQRKQMWETAVGVLWGIGNIWKGLLVPNSEQIQILIHFCDTTPDSKLKVQCVGTLECLAQYPDDIECNQAISNYLLSMLPLSAGASPVGTEPLIQALSALIDIYSDENMPYDINFRQGCMLQKLADSVDGVKRAVKAIDRRKEPELRRRGEEVRENLVEFISYRRNLGV